MSERPLPTSPSQTDPVASPCVRNCCLDENDICMGCFRSVEEIIRWGSASNNERQSILDSARRRRPA